MKKNSLIIIFYVILTSCSTSKYIDLVANQQILIGDGQMLFHDDFNELEFHSNITLTKDKEKYTPKSFKVNLPKGIKYIKVINSSKFYFIYDSKQLIYIKLDYEHQKDQSINYISEPSHQKLNKILAPITDNYKKNKNFTLNESIIGKSSNNILLKKNDYEILLFNIKDENLQNHILMLSTLSIIK